MTERRVSSASVPRKPGKPKKGQPYRLNLVLDGTLVEQVDEFARRLAAEDEYGRGASRTDAFRVLLVEGLRARNAQK
jgi:hypothetical protein